MSSFSSVRGLKQQREGGQVASWFACGAGRQINQAHASVLIRDLRFTAVVTERYLLANGIVCLETLLIASLPFPSRRISGCKAMSGEEQGEECFVKEAWDLEQGFNSPSSRRTTTQHSSFRLVSSGDI